MSIIRYILLFLLIYIIGIATGWSWKRNTDIEDENKQLYEMVIALGGYFYSSEQIIDSMFIHNQSYWCDTLSKDSVFDMYLNNYEACISLGFTGEDENNN